MSNSERVRAARKKAQMARIEKKTDDDYPLFYASQPLQNVKHGKNEQIRKAKASVREAEEVLSIAEITGENYEQAKESLIVSRMVVSKLIEAKRDGPRPSLSIGGDDQ